MLETYDNQMAVKAGALDGLTIMRFAHSFESGGGMEQHLADLDDTLLRRNAMTIIRMYLASAGQEEQVLEPKPVGRGVLIKVKLETREVWESVEQHQAKTGPVAQFVRYAVLYNRICWLLYGKAVAMRRPVPTRKGDAVGAGIMARHLLERWKVDLVMLHHMGSSDVDEVISEARAQSVPCAIQNHYANERLGHLSVRKHALLARAVAGINDIEVPHYVKRRFTNLGNGIDTDLFRPAPKKPAEEECEEPLILLPARIVRVKGQLDLVRIAAELHYRGNRCSIAFAGRVDSPAFEEELRSEIQRHGLEKYVRFLGTLNKCELQRWYERCLVVAFPTYHHEGLGRVLLEGQAMERPVVTYNTGGVAEALLSGESGYLVPTGDLDAFTDRLEQLLKDPALRKRMGAVGRKYVTQRYSLAALAGRHETFYQETLANGG